jgi:CRISPR-associated protein Csd1
MGWIQKLYETYENCQSMIGAGADENKVPLLPICHTTQKAQIEIVIDQEGNFLRARFVPKAQGRTIVPCTESSGGRAGKKPMNHPLCDKLQYIAKDFVTYGGVVTIGYANNPAEPHENYVDSLKKWCDSSYSHSKVEAVLMYVEKGHVIKDLVENYILCVGPDNFLLENWDKETVKETVTVKQDEAFVRWIVEAPGEQQTAVWNDFSLFESWIKYYLSSKTDRSFCYVTGMENPLAEQHPAKLRNDADKAKIISSNDTSGFTFRGRFSTAEQACGVSFEVTQKAHNILRWLIDRQGYKNGEQAIVAWAISGAEIPDPFADPFSILGIYVEKTGKDVPTFTAQDLAIKLSKKIAGYSVNLGSTARVVVMGLDSATPGRMAVTYYRELDGSEFLQRLENWHTTCCWVHDYRYIDMSEDEAKKKKASVRFVGAPAPRDIVEGAYGTRVDDKLRKKTVERILPCLIDGQRIPRDLVEAAVRRTSNRNSYEEWEWNKALSITCALYRKYKIDYEKEDYKMALETDRRNRDYLYGRLLALADGLERWALKKSGENRQTTAERLMQRFADHPYSTWRTIELSLVPYKARLGAISTNLQNKISGVMALFEHEDFTSDRRLSGEFLLGYHCQKEALWNKDIGDSKEDLENEPA